MVFEYLTTRGLQNLLVRIHIMVLPFVRSRDGGYLSTASLSIRCTKVWASETGQNPLLKGLITGVKIIG